MVIEAVKVPVHESVVNFISPERLDLEEKTSKINYNIIWLNVDSPD